MKLINTKKAMEMEMVVKILIGIALLLIVLVLVAKFGGFLNGEGFKGLSNLFRFGS